ncbi:MAG: protoglobin domain-containing protein [Fimbriiglobus sp.]|nr:protoglobin domain-containing protein [Fimbriiglobus sp.]
MSETFGWSEPALSARLAALDLTPAERLALATAWPGVREAADALAVGLYQRFRAVPALAELFSSDERVTRLVATLKEYLRALFCDPIDTGYVSRLLAVGVVHHRLRVTPQWYLAANAHLLSGFVPPLLATAESPAAGLRRLVVLVKSLLFDASVVLTSYGQSADQAMTAASPAVAPATTDGHPASESGVPNERGVSRIPLTREEAEARANFIGLSAADVGLIRSVREPLSAAISPVLAEFYQMVMGSPELADLVPTDQVARLIGLLGAYWEEFLDGRFDRPYAASRMRVGVIHERIGLPPHWYLIGLARQASGLLAALPPTRPDLPDVAAAIVRGVVYDVTFVVDAYMTARADTLLHAEGIAGQLLSGLTSAVAVADPHGRVMFANAPFVALCGIEPGMLYLLPLADAVPVAEVGELVAQARGGEWRATALSRWGEGMYRITATELNRERAAGERPVVVVFDEVSGLLNAGVRLESDAAHFERMANAVPAVLWELDVESDTLVTLSRQAFDLTGYRAVTLLGRSGGWTNLVAESDRAGFQAACMGVEPGGVAVCEYRVRRADGRQAWVRTHLSRPSDPDRRVLAGISLEVTAAREADERRMKALGLVAGGLAHVLNNAMTVVLGNLELQASSPDTPDGQFLAAATAAARKAAAAATRLQAFAGGRFLRPRSVDLAAFVSAHVADWQRALGPHIRCTVHTPPGLWQVSVDPDELDVAIHHLLDNARRAAPGGQVTVGVRNVTAGEGDRDRPSVGGEWVEVSVHDNGTGMTEEVRRRAVEPFFTTRVSAEGAGLGLSCAYGFAGQSGGHLNLISEPGKGTTVAMRFPRLTAPPGPPPAGTARPPRVLVVEDEAGVRALFTHLLQASGFQVVAAGTAAEAEVVFDTVPVDVLLTDVLLGEGLDGLTLAHRLTARLPSLRVIVTSGYVPLDEHGTNLPSGWVRLPKPFSLAQLIVAIRSLPTPDVSGA